MNAETNDYEVITLMQKEQKQCAEPVLPGVKREFALAEQAGISLCPYFEAGYDSDQLDGIRYALEIGIKIQPYLNLQYRGACIKEIAIGLKEGLDVSNYMDLRYTWRKMREIRLGMEQNLDISRYQDPLYSYWQMREIRLGLKAGLDVSFYDNFMYTAKEMRKRRLILNNRKNSPDLSGNWTILSEKEYDLCISPDGLKAYLNWHSGKIEKTVDELEVILRNNGIVYGIDHKALEDLVKRQKKTFMLSEEDCNTLVARGKKPKHGKDGYYEWKFHAGRKRTPDLKEDGTIDFDSMKWFDFVKKGQILAVYHFVEPSVDGMSVFGEIIRAKTGKEKPVLCGRGFEILPDFKTYVASADGHVSLKNKELIVEELLLLDEVQNMSQPLCYDGDVYIRGNIEGPIALEVNGDLVVDGFVQGARIKCKGNLILKGGINNVAGQEKVYAGGRVISRFFEYVTLHAEGNVYFGTSLNSDLSTYGEMVSYGEKGCIVGGNSYSEKGFCLSNIGNSAGIPTALNLGSNEAIRSVYADLEREIMEIKEAMTKLVSARNQIIFNRKIEKNKMEEMILQINSMIEKKERELIDANQRMENVRKRDKRACQSRIIVEQKVYENVQVYYLNQKITAIPSSHIEIRIDNKNLVMEKRYWPREQTA
ncbi:MAG: DUF342 domain-containing protein [Lachnospiraceae bacterium]|nr:DUF342 domain-containing protein [Lachnospiraceae bacterium]